LNAPRIDGIHQLDKSWCGIWWYRTEEPFDSGNGTSRVIAAGGGPSETFMLQARTHSEKFRPATDVYWGSSEANGVVRDWGNSCRLSQASIYSIRYRLCWKVTFSSCYFFVQHLFENLFVNSNVLLPRCMQCRCSLAMRKLSVRPSVHLSNAWIVTKPKKDLSKFLYHTKDHLA